MSAFGGSVRARLVAVLIAGIAVVWIAAAVATAIEADHEVREVFDANLARSAALLAMRIGDEVDEVDTGHARSLHKYAKPLSFQVWKRGQRLLLHSADAPATPFSEKDQGFSTVTIDGRDWRVFSLRGPDGEFVVQVRDAVDDRRHLTAEVAKALVKPLAVALPLLALLVWLATGRAFRPLARVSEEISRRDPSYLAPLEGDVPSEIAPLVARLNALLARVQSSLDGERRFTADAAHELRTPLAALRAQIQVAQGGVGGDRDRAIAQALSAAERATRVVEQLLVLARLEHRAWQQAAGTFDLRAVAAECLAERAAQARAKRIELSLAGPENAMARGHAGLAAIAAGNLIDNAIRYSPPDTAVAVAVGIGDGRATLRVTDEGPGIPAARREEALRRFARLDDSAAEGSGLGLSIVARIAQLHGESVALDDGPGGKGLQATLSFPSA